MPKPPSRRGCESWPDSLRMDRGLRAGCQRSKSIVKFGSTFEETQSEFCSQHGCNGEIEERNVDSTSRDLIYHVVCVSEIFIQQWKQAYPEESSRCTFLCYWISQLKCGWSITQLTPAHLATQSILESNFGCALPRITSTVEID